MTQHESSRSGSASPHGVPLHHPRMAQASRREFFNSSASGLGGIALGSMLSLDGVLGPNQVQAALSQAAVSPLAARPPHFAPRAKSCIFLFQAGAPSHLDLFDPKPKLNELDGKPLPESMTKNVRFAFIKKESAVLMGTHRKFTRYGDCGMQLSDRMPYTGQVADELCMVRSMHSEQFNHHPGQLMMQCGRGTFGLPSAGAWLTYGLGNASSNLPGYVVLTTGRGSSGGATLWQSGFLPTVYGGVLFRDQGEPVLNLSTPSGISDELQRATFETLRRIHRGRYQEIHDPEILSRIANYELAARMQSAAPELIDLTSETQATLDAYGVSRSEPDWGSGRGKLGDTMAGYARNCLLARRLVERGVRFVNIVYASWDHHSNIDPELKYNATVVDQPFAALVMDLKQRGMLDETLVVWAGEFGRTPLGENRNGRTTNTGRDHHPFAFTILMAGGGIQGGLTYGASDELGWGVEDKPVHINDLHATMLHLFGLDHLRLTHRVQGRDFRLTDVGGNVLNEWLA